MKDFAQQLDFYDYFAHILVGFYFVCTAGFVIWVVSPVTLRVALNWVSGNIVLVLILAFLFGHILQAISNYFEPSDKDKENQENTLTKKILSDAAKFFDFPGDSMDKQLWRFCYLYVLSDDRTGHVRRFNSLSGLYRGLKVSSQLVYIISAILISYEIAKIAIDISNLTNLFMTSLLVLVVTLITMLIAIEVFGKRKRQFNQYLNEKVLMIFEMQSKKLL